MNAKQRGRPRKEPVAFDPEQVKSYIQRLFLVEQEIKTLREGKSDLKEEFKDKVDMKLVSNVIRLVKAQLRITVSEETKGQLEQLILDKINMVVE
ncbi:MAG: hypothetical protein Q8P81_00865 [Nanoarchaeota archaeon]|nr:hypothetical protein [Nanoarchaeota archaeon]